MGEIRLVVKILNLTLLSGEIS